MPEKKIPETKNKASAPIYDCLVVGAGISGLTAADHLQRSGWNVAVLDKARGAGGRMATRRKKVNPDWANPVWANPVWDHGAQYMTVRTPVAQALLDQWRANMPEPDYGQLQDWYNLAPSQDQHSVRWIGTRGMTTLPKYLAASLTTFFETRIVNIGLQSFSRAFLWELTADDGRQFRGQNIVLTMPVPQAVVLIEASQETLKDLGSAFNTTAFESMKSIQYDPCLAVLAELSSPSNIPPPGFVEFRDSPETANAPLAFLGDNYQKGISSAYTVTLHGSPEWSKAYFDAAETEITHQLIQAAAPWLDISQHNLSQVISTQLMRWRYSQVSKKNASTSFPEGFCTLSDEPGLLLAGDGFGGPRIEAAILSGLSAAKALTSTNKIPAIKV
ncbi:MAG: FAD-dependent oxidoreductase [Cyanobacteria bacterium]|nr:FAD-dependent oxidoreductase [Cyanobacteriota bacterium]